MAVIAVVGAQWGDEGKGKVVDMLAERVKMVVRFSGGDNAGHTVINPIGDFKLHLIPSGIFYPSVTCIIGSGTVINPARLIEEIDKLNHKKVDTSHLVISDRAHLVMPYHLLLDGLEEESRAGKAIGTTRRGIGPAFADKVARLGIRAGELLDKKALLDRLASILEHKNAILTKIYGAEPLSLDEVYEQYCRYGERLAGYIKETTTIIRKARERGDGILLEGAQGALLDPDYGTYPYTTSSSPLAGGGSLGAGIGPTGIDRVLGVFKAYCTRVGGGPMPTELEDETGNRIRERACEYGTTTGRPRRCGWFDAVAAGLSNQVNGLTGMAITRLDVLDDLPELKICVAYELDGRTIDYFPSSAATLERCRPIYEKLEGWQADTTDVRRFDDLPEQAKKYVKRLEELISCPADLICVGPAREQKIEVRPVL
ncbi:MAG TPA: adenylosuccinate synthase [Dehalococcoidia bacterium]|nr:adenylosuccinate synthase [Dehalococcoidia bacterium]